MLLALLEPTIVHSPDAPARSPTDTNSTSARSLITINHFLSAFNLTACRSGPSLSVLN